MAAQVGVVVAFYYLWYGTPAHDGRYLHWDHTVLPHWQPAVQAQYAHLEGFNHTPPHLLHSPFYPQRGCYSSRDPAVLRVHFECMKAHGIDAAVVSWTGRGGKTSDTQGVVTDEVLPGVLAVAEEVQLTLSHKRSPTLAQVISDLPDRSPQSVASDLSYLHAQYGGSSALLRMQRPHCENGQQRDAHQWCPEVGLPVVYVYDSYHNPATEWAQVLCGPGGGVRGTPHDAFLISTLLTLSDKELVVDGCFDGAYTYFATDGFTYGSSSQNWRDLNRWATQHRKLFVPSVGPGYNDTKIRPWNSQATRARAGGEYYKRMWDAALASGTLAVSITSFNEWGEGTQIEPAAVPALGSLQPLDGAGLSALGSHLDYGGDPELYLRITLEKKQALHASRDGEL